MRREVLDHLLIFGPRQLERVLRFVDHYHTARPHQGLGQRTPIGAAEVRSEPIQPKSSGSIASMVSFTSNLGQRDAS